MRLTHANPIRIPFHYEYAPTSQVEWHPVRRIGSGNNGAATATCSHIIRLHTEFVEERWLVTCR